MANPIYVHTEDVHNTLAAEVVLPLLLRHIQPKSVIDIGCGIGTWLKVFEQLGVSDLIGVDTKYVDRSILKIDESKFIEHDLTTPFNLEKEFDLVISLEVAEHLPEIAADIFIKTLVNHGKVILFSAAIPGQGGQNHINEQWPFYWQEKFDMYGYEYYDLIRPAIWNNEQVDRWYRQNIFLVVHKSLEILHPSFKGDNLIHPAYWKDVKKLRRIVKNWEEGDVQFIKIFRALFLAIMNRFKLKSKV